VGTPQGLYLASLNCTGLDPTRKMKYNSDYHHRRSIRLPEYDYSQAGIYFVTICTYKKQCLFGEIKQGKMLLNQIGKMVAQEWLKSSEIREELTLDEWIIMPNHVHGLVVITKDDYQVNSGDVSDDSGSASENFEGANNSGSVSGNSGSVSDNSGSASENSEGASLAPLLGKSAQRKPKSLSTFVSGFKSSVTKRIKKICVENNPRVWQKNYYESIVRDEIDLNKIRQYILDNPQNWDDDPENQSDLSQELQIELLF
jgi:REP element-mobilizing transposase RayT